MIAVSALILIISYFVPIWEILMWAPQYPEGLEMKIWLHTITGDYKIISGLNHYIGMKHIDVSMFPEFKYMGIIVGIVIACGLIAVVVNRQFALWAYVVIILGAGVAGMVDFYLWGYDYGHNLDPNAAIRIPGMAYQPPLLGTKQLLNFTAYSGPDTGGYVFLVSSLLALAALLIEWRRARIHGAAVVAATVMLTSCSVSPEPLRYGVDACDHCKMILMDKNFGAEAVTSKGKIFRFDDVNCMKSWIDKSSNDQELKFIMVVDFNNEGKLIDATKASFVVADQVRSPMGSSTAAFADHSVAEKYSDDWGGELKNWGQLEYK